MKKAITYLCLISLILFGLGSCKLKDKTDEFGLKVRGESEHFVFYSNERDSEIIGDLKKKLETNFQRITKDLNKEIKYKIYVKIYPDITSYRKAIGKYNPYQYEAAMGIGNEIKMLSPLNGEYIYTYDGLMQNNVYQLTHLIISNINYDVNSLPGWLSIGTALYESNWMDGNIRNKIKEDIEEKKIPNIKDLRRQFFVNLDEYAFSYTITEFIVKEYGYDKLLELIKIPQNLPKIFDVSEDDFNNQWVLYLTENYGKS